MDSHNLAVVIGPTLFPVEEKRTTATACLTKLCELLKLFIENADSIGFIPRHIIDIIAPPSEIMSASSDENVTNKRKKKRRSGSLTRMFNGLRKIVSSKSIESPSPTTNPPDLISTPRISKMTRKRKIEVGGFSNKKKKEVLQNLPQGTTLNTPVSIHPNPRKKSSPKSIVKSSAFIKEKKSQWNLSSRRKHTKQNDANSNGSENRWFSVNPVSGFSRRNKIRISSHATTACSENAKILADCDIENYVQSVKIEEKHLPEPDYVKISRYEYEEIKNRVSAIEQQISQELDNLQEQTENVNNNPIINVQTAYEKTLVEAKPLSPTTDELARRLSKELKIRRSLEQRVVRSPSARKIGSLRRRSKDLERQNTKISRNQSWHLAEAYVTPRMNLKRGRPNTVYTGLRPLKPNDDINSDYSINRFCTSVLRKTTPLISRLSDKKISNSSDNICLNSEKWRNAAEIENIIEHLKINPACDKSANLRPSIAKLRSQNLGMVSAKVRLFDELLDSDYSNHSNNSSASASLPNITSGRKIGAVRNTNKITQRIKSIKSNEKCKQSISPKKKTLRNNKSGVNSNVFLHKSKIDDKENVIASISLSSSMEKVQTVALKDCNRLEISDSRIKVESPIYLTPKGMPHIKKALSIKSSKRICHTSIYSETKKTPMKILTTQQIY